MANSRCSDSAILRSKVIFYSLSTLNRSFQVLKIRYETLFILKHFQIENIRSDKYEGICFYICHTNHQTEESPAPLDRGLRG